MWWYGLGLAQLPNLASDGVFVSLIVCISTPVQVLLLALMARWAGADPNDYFGLSSSSPAPNADCTSVF